MAKCISLSSPCEKKILWQNCDVPNKSNPGLKPFLISRALRPGRPAPHGSQDTQRDRLTCALLAFDSSFLSKLREWAAFANLYLPLDSRRSSLSFAHPDVTSNLASTARIARSSPRP